MSETVATEKRITDLEEQLAGAHKLSEWRFNRAVQLEAELVKCEERNAFLQDQLSKATNRA